MMPMGYWRRPRINDFMARVKETRHLEQENYVTMKAANYKKPDLKVISEELNHFTKEEQETVYKILTKNEDAFQGTRGTWKGKEFLLELKREAEPYFTRPYQIPKSVEKIFKDEIVRLVKIGLLTQVYESEWAAPTYGIPKKDQTIRVVSDFCKLNTMIKRKPYPLPRIQDTIQSIGQFKFASCIDLIVGYWGMGLSKQTKKSCTIILP